MGESSVIPAAGAILCDASWVAHIVGSLAMQTLSWCGSEHVPNSQTKFNAFRDTQPLQSRWRAQQWWNTVVYLRPLYTNFAAALRWILQEVPDTRTGWLADHRMPNAVKA